MQWKVLIISVALLGVVITPDISWAHPGNTDNRGGHYCWTNCASWGYDYGEYHFHYTNYTNCSLPIQQCNEIDLQNLQNKKSQWITLLARQGGLGYSSANDSFLQEYDTKIADCRYEINEYNRQYTLYKECLLEEQKERNSTVESLNEQIKLLKIKEIEKLNLACDTQLKNSSYNEQTAQCNCKSGYRMNADGTQCVQIVTTEICQEKYGIFSFAQGNTCQCGGGAVLVDSDRCMYLTNDYCRNKFGSEFVYNSNNQRCEIEKKRPSPVPILTIPTIEAKEEEKLEVRNSNSTSSVELKTTSSVKIKPKLEKNKTPAGAIPAQGLESERLLPEEAPSPSSVSTPNIPPSEAIVKGTRITWQEKMKRKIFQRIKQFLRNK